ncbi:MAG TPA: ANTAR domain-containing protein [Longimicrobiaceae bacterium]|nr:ANTAR domain-containing protein [Longimicrobiaceae bacterium]
MDILLAGGRSAEAAALRASMESLGHRVFGPAPGAREAAALLRSRRPSVAVLVLEEAAGAAEVGAACPLPLVLVLPRRDPAIVERTAGLAVFACLVEPVAEEQIGPALRLALARWDEMSALRVRVAELARRVEQRGAVERAKGILMEVRGISEGDAYRLLRRESQNLRKSMAEVAGTVVAMEGVFRARAGAAPRPEPARTEACAG